LEVRALWRVVTHLQVLVAFLSLYLTGEMHAWASLAFGLGWLIVPWIRKAPAWWNASWGALATMVVTLAIAMAARQLAFNGVIYLLFYLVLAKSIAPRRAKDILQVQIMAFFMMLAAAAITVAFFFSFVFLGYVVLATVSLALYGLVIGQEGRARAGRGPEAVAAGPSPRGITLGGRLSRRFVIGALALAAAAVTGTVLYFVFIPHVSMRQIDAPLAGRPGGPDRLMGFSEEVTLGDFKRLEPDPTVVMRVEVDWPPGAASTDRPPLLRMRGVALDVFEGNRWRKFRRPTMTPATLDRRHLNPVIPTSQIGRIMHQRIYQDSDITLRLFAAPMPLEIDLMRELSIRHDGATGSAQIAAFGGGRDTAYTNPLVYQVRSNAVDEATPLLVDYIRYEQDLRRRTAQVLRTVNDPDTVRLLRDTSKGRGPRDRRYPWLSAGRSHRLSAQERLVNTQLPAGPLAERLREHSLRVAPGPTEAGIVFQLLGHLRTGYVYTVEQEPRPGEDPIEAFVFRTQRGHCEYFATALVLMLRSRGIPARLVNGFYTTEWNDLAGVFVVRQSDAHSWVEAWIDELGWLTVDPTPAGAAGRAVYGLAEDTFLRRLNEYARVLWQRGVIDYSQAKQQVVFASLWEELEGSAFGRLASGAWRQLKSGPPEEARPVSTSRPQVRWGRLLDGLLVILALLLLRRLAPLARFGRRRRVARSEIDYFNRLMARLERAGWRRPSWQTPLEFVQAVAGAVGPDPDLRWLVELYYRHRFAGRPPSAEDRRRAGQVIARLRPSDRRRRA